MRATLPAPASLGSAPGWRTGIPWFVFPPLLALGLWAASLQAVNLRAMGDLGLLTVLPTTFFAALAVLIVSYAIAVNRGAPSAVLVLHVVLFILMIHGTPCILYGSLRYSWAWKHVGIVDYIVRFGSLDPREPVLGAYHNWPGFFALAAFASQAIGISVPLGLADGLAKWGPVYMNLLLLTPLWLIFRSLSGDRRLVWLGIWLFYLTSWVGQDYFAPQALGFLLHLLIVAILLTWFSAAPTPLWQKWRRLQGRLVDRAVGLGLVRPCPPDRPLPPTSSQTERIALLGLVVLFYWAIVSSHQLTPFMTIFAISALVVFRQTSVRALPILLVMLVVLWIIFGAADFVGANRGAVAGSVGQPAGSVSENLIDLEQVSAGQQLVALGGRALTLGVWGLAGLGALRRMRQGRWDMTAYLLAYIPFVILGGNSYGGEVLFRVYLFALPMMVFLGAGLFYPSIEVGKSWWTAVVTTLIAVALFAGFCFAYYGKENTNYFTPEEVAASDYLFSVAPAGSHMIDGSYNYPTMFRNYEEFSYWGLVDVPREVQQKLLWDDPVDAFAKIMSDPKWPEVYLVITRSMKAHVNSTGVMRRGTLEHLEATLRASDRFTVFYSNRDVTIFTLTQRAGRTGR